MPPVDELQIRPNVTGLLTAIRRRSAKFTPQVRYRDVGTVQQIGNGVATLSGLAGVQIDELVLFGSGMMGLVFEFGANYVHVILLGSAEGIQGGDLVTRTGHRLKIPVGMDLLGRVVNPLGQPLDERGPIDAQGHWLLEREAPAIVSRAPVNRPLYTGWKMIDALLPIGRGQRELILGDRQTGKTTIAIDTICRQVDQNVKSVYVAIGQKKSTVLRVLSTLQRAGALAQTVVVMAGPDDPPALRYLAPYAGCSMAERLMAAGYDTLIVYDDLTRHADAYRELSLLLRRPPGREAYPGDIFYLHSRLLERAAQMHPDEGGRSMTALPIAQTQRGNVASYIPTNLISITDGQIILNSDRFNQGLKPAVDIGLSVSRVGAAAQKPVMRLVAGRLKLELAQFEEVAHFARFGADVDPTTRQQIERGERLQMLLTQEEHSPLSLADQIVVLFAATKGYADHLSTRQIAAWEESLLAFMRHQAAELLRDIEEEGALDEEQQETLTHLLDDFAAQTFLEADDNENQS